MFNVWILKGMLSRESEVGLDRAAHFKARAVHR